MDDFALRRHRELDLLRSVAMALYGARHGGLPDENSPAFSACKLQAAEYIAMSEAVERFR